jgi:WD40 repeat protein
MNRIASGRVAASISFCVLHFAFCILHCDGGVATAQQTPSYRRLDATVHTPPTLQMEPVLLSRQPTTLSMALSTDGRRLRTADIDGRVWQRSARQRNEPRLVAEMGCEPACAVLSSDARWLAFAAAEGSVAVMDLEAAQIKFRDDAVAERSAALVFSPDSRFLADVTVGGAVRVWDVVKGKRIREFATDPGPVQTLAFSPDGARLAIASYGQEIKLYRVTREGSQRSTGDPQVIRAGGSRVTAFAFTPDAEQLVIATSDGAARLLGLATNRKPIELGTHPFAIWSIVFERNGHRMAAGSWDGTIKLWDTISWQPVQSVKKHEESVAAMIFDGERGLVSAGLDGRLLHWLPEVSSISPFAMIAGRDDSVWAAVYSPDGNRLFVGGRGSRFELWDVESHRLLVSRAGHPTTRCAAFSPDGATLATGGDDGAICLCDASTGQSRMTLLRHPGAVSAVVFVEEGRTLISACDGGLVKVWDTASGQEQASWREHQQQIYCATISPDGKWLLTGGGNWTTGDPGELLVWERKTGRVHARVTGHKLAVWAIVFTPDGKRFFSSDSSGDVKVWHSETLEEERTLHHSTWVRPLALSPDGTTLAVGRGDGSVRLWDTTTWTETASCDGHKSFSFWLQYAPDGQTLASGGVDGTVRFWQPPPRPRSASGE